MVRSNGLPHFRASVESAPCIDTRPTRPKPQLLPITMGWRADVFFYDSTGSQIGSVLTTPVNFNYTGAANPTVTVVASTLDKTPTRTDMDGDGMDDFFTPGTDSSSIAAYKIDVTALAASSSDNTGIFIYFVAESAAGTFAGFTP